MTELRNEPLGYKIYGQEHIAENATAQMDIAMRLPVSLAGALMPDAHLGYGVPIGGVIATPANIIIPGAVGVDIGCRMQLSVYPVPADMLDKNRAELKAMLKNNTVFGTGATNNRVTGTDKAHALFSRPEWKSNKVLSDLYNRAESQYGTSGSGNHFVEFGTIRAVGKSAIGNNNPDNLGLDLDDDLAYLAVLSHSGSRGFGAMVANHYTKLAERMGGLPEEAKKLSWLDLETEENHNYWIAMNLAGDYASGNHHEIHAKFAESLGMQPIVSIENHHNFAWLEKLEDGTSVMVHRKGATPAGKGVLGIIPGSMSTPGFVVSGKGNAASINSASHGAGRNMGRNEAKRRLNPEDAKADLKSNNITLIGGSIDEASAAYKDIHTVMAAQTELLNVLAEFRPS
ncbi:MAG: RtcB family protein, partial [Bacteroidota bacterium]